MGLKNQLIKNFVGVGAMKLLSIPIGLTTSIILARTLGPEAFGQYAFIMALVPLISLPVNGGLPQLLTREIATIAHSKNWSLYKGALRASHTWVMLITLLVLSVFGVVWMGFNSTLNTGRWSLLPIALIMIPLGGLAAVRTGTMKGLGLPAYAELPTQLVQPTAVLVVIAILASHQTLNKGSAIWGQVLAAAMAFLLASWMFSKVQPTKSRGVEPQYHLNRWGKALLPFSVLAFISMFNSQIGLVVLGFTSTDDQISAMRVAERSGQLVTTSLGLVNMVIAPYIVRAFRDGDRELLQKLSRITARGSFLLSLPVGACLILWGEPIVGLVFGESYARISYAPVVIITIGQLANTFFGSVGFLLAMTGNERESLKGQLISLMITVVLSLSLVPRFGAVGAATAVSVGIVGWNIFLARKVYSNVGIRPGAL